MRKLLIANLIFVALVFAIALYAQQPVAQSGTWNIGTLTSITNPVAVTGTFFQSTQPVSIASAQVASGAYASGSISDGAEVTLGSKADAKSAATDTTAITIMQVLKEISAMVQAPASTPVTGTFFQTTQPVSCTAANCAINVAQINGNTTSTAASGTQLVGIEGHAGVAVDGATGSAVPANALYLGGNGSGNTTGLVTCDNSAAFNLTTGTTTQIIAISGTGGRTYICSFNIVVSAADNVTLISGSGTNCASNVAALIGGTTAANGWNFAANGGLTMGSGVGMIIKTTTTNNEVCLVTSATAVASGSITYTQF